ncbi:nucleotidyltransferase family protein [Flavobacteriaceae bacterium]|nr:nucleotidyltransferase family protein [Flavobacteriaceae bacterium]
MNNNNYKKHIILFNLNVKEALIKLNSLGLDAILFVVNNNFKLIGSLTDGDIRRGLIKGLDLNDEVKLFVQENPKYIQKEMVGLKEIIELRKKNFKLIPIVNNNLKVVNILNFRLIKSLIPVDVVIMAGGRGERLKPLTNEIPKPLLMVGDKSIIDHNIDRLMMYGVINFHITLGYLPDLIKNHLGNGKSKGISFNYLIEDEPMGTIGSVSLIKNIENEYVLLTNSDILTNMNYEDFYMDCISKNADMSVVSVPYSVDIPYAVINSNGDKISSFEEKPCYTYYSNGGIYLIKKSILNKIPKNNFFNATDLMDLLIKENHKIISYKISDYWLDIGKHQDFNKAKNDIDKINFD